MQEMVKEDSKVKHAGHGCCQYHAKESNSVKQRKLKQYEKVCIPFELSIMKSYLILNCYANTNHFKLINLSKYF